MKRKYNKKFYLCGRKFNFLTVLKNLGIRPNSSGKRDIRYIRCECRCGKIIDTPCASVVKGDRTSCGCINKKKPLVEIKCNHNQATRRYRLEHLELYRNYANKYRYKPGTRYTFLRSYSKRRLLPLSLTKQQHFNLLKQPCYYCNISLENGAGVGLDRKNNEKGYEINNVLPCCGPCNRIRNNYLTVDEMKFIMTKLKQYRKEDKNSAFIC